MYPAIEVASAQNFAVDVISARIVRTQPQLLARVVLNFLAKDVRSATSSRSSVRPSYRSTVAFFDIIE